MAKGRLNLEEDDDPDPMVGLSDGLGFAVWLEAGEEMDGGSARTLEEVEEEREEHVPAGWATADGLVEAVQPLQIDGGWFCCGGLSQEGG